LGRPSHGSDNIEKRHGSDSIKNCERVRYILSFLRLLAYINFIIYAFKDIERIILTGYLILIPMERLSFDSKIGIITLTKGRGIYNLKLSFNRFFWGA
jgi:hypothetical protein